MPPKTGRPPRLSVEAIATAAEAIVEVKVYFDIENIHSAVARVRELGGEADEIDESPSGYQVDCRDDQGTAFSLHQARSAE